MCVEGLQFKWMVMEISLTKWYLSQGDRWRPWDHLGEKTGRKEALRWEYARRSCKAASMARVSGRKAVGNEVKEVTGAAHAGSWKPL